MALAPRLFAVVSHRPAEASPPATLKRAVNMAELRESKLKELKGKQAIDRAETCLRLLEQRQTQYGLAIAALQKRKACAAARIAKIEDEILTRMDEAGLTKVDGFAHVFTARPAPEALDVVNASLIPAEYIRTTVSTAPDKTAIKKALAAGVKILGVKLTAKITLLRK